MSVIFVLISLSIFVAGSFLLLFFLAIKDGQYDDTETPARRMLFENTFEDKNKNH